MLLATKSGWTILVDVIAVIGDKTTVQAIDTKQTYTVSPRTKNMKLFPPGSTVEEAMNWMAEPIK